MFFSPWKTSFRLLDTSSTPLETSLFYRGFLGFSWYLSTNSPIHWAKFLFSLFAWQKLNTSLIHRSSLAIDTSSIPLNLSRFCSRYILDLSRWLILYILEVCLFHAWSYIFSLNPNLFFSPKSLFPSRIQPLPSLNPLVSVLNLFFFSFFLHFMHLNLGFQVFGKFLGFLSFCEIFLVGFCWYVITCSCIAFSIIITMFHAF